MKINLSILNGLRTKWKDGGPLRDRVDNWIYRQWNTSDRKRLVRATIRRLWKQNLAHWMGVHDELLREALEDGLLGPEADQQALADLKSAFMVSLEKQLVRKLDQRTKWAFVGNPVFRRLLEDHDRTLFATLVATARVSISIALDRIPLLATIEDRIDEELEDLLADLSEEDVGIEPVVILGQRVILEPARPRHPLMEVRVTTPPVRASAPAEAEPKTVITVNPAPKDDPTAVPSSGAEAAGRMKAHSGGAERTRKKAAAQSKKDMEAAETMSNHSTHSIPAPSSVGADK